MDYFYYPNCANRRARVLLTRLQEPFSNANDEDAWYSGYAWLLRVDVWNKNEWDHCTEEYLSEHKAAEYVNEMRALGIPHEPLNPLMT